MQYDFLLVIQGLGEAEGSPMAVTSQVISSPTMEKAEFKIKAIVNHYSDLQKRQLVTVNITKLYDNYKAA